MRPQPRTPTFLMSDMITGSFDAAHSNVAQTLLSVLVRSQSTDRSVCATFILPVATNAPSSFIVHTSSCDPPEAASPTAGVRVAAQRCGQRDDLSAAAGLPGFGSRRDAGHGRRHRR